MNRFSDDINLAIAYRLPVILYCVLIFWQSSFPSIVSGPSSFLCEDKILHFFGYAVLGMLCARDLAAEKPSWSAFKIQVAATIFSALYGLSDEIHQAFVPARTCSAFDFLADVSGSLAGCMVYMKFLHGIKK
jgi:VanZ family protein